jgi:hypothetical protein
MNNKGDKFLWICKENYLKGITPSNPIHYNDTEYQALVDIGTEYFKNGEIEEFSYFLGESQYFVPLWVAHIILENGKPNDVLKNECIETIKEYSDNPLAPKVSEEERTWLKKNLFT